MHSNRLYLDHNASSPLLPAAKAAMLEAIGLAELAGNASSVHFEGRNARKFMENARAVLAKSLGVEEKQVIFTSGASEAAAHALSPVIRAGGQDVPVSKLFVSAVEHPCVLAGGRFAKTQIEVLPVLESGFLDLAELKKRLANHDHGEGLAMVAVMLANNETGLIQPLEKIASIVHEHNALLVVDAVQAFGRLPVNPASLGAHFTLLSSHKIGGPQGAGALILGDASMSPQPLIAGGGQENYQRAGTENVAAIAGFAAAAGEIGKRMQKNDQVAALRDSIEAGVVTICNNAGNKAGEPVFFAQDQARLPNTSCFAIPGVKSGTALISLDLAGIAISSGSACSSGKVKKSHVLHAMGISDDLAECALRISTGYETTQEDAGRFLGELKNIVNRIG